MLRCIVAIDERGYMAIDDKMPWGSKPLPEDGAMFAFLTKGTDVLMGRRTWETLPPRVQKSKDRNWWVATKSPEPLENEASMTRCTHVLEWCKVSSRSKITCNIIGGPTLLEGVGHLVDELWVTIVSGTPFPRAWNICSILPHSVRANKKLVATLALSSRCRLERWVS